MNANELAEALDDLDLISGYKVVAEAQTMLRQQQAEIQALKGDGKVCARCGAIAYDPVITQTPKTLTDEEIIEIWSGMETDTGEQNIIFARAILKKAQEK